MTRCLTVLLGAALATSLSISTLRAGDLIKMSPGTKVSGFATLGKKQLPLPAGEWEMVFAETDTWWSSGRTVTSYKHGQVLLAQKSEDGTVLGLLYARTSFDHRGRGWKPSKLDCNRKDVHHDDSDSKVNAFDCWQVNHFVHPPDKHRWWSKVHSYMKETVGATTFVGNAYYKSGSGHYLRLRHSINPDAYGFRPLTEDSWNTSIWNKKSIGFMKAEYTLFVDAVKEFGEKYREAFRAGFQNDLKVDVPAVEFVYRQ